MSRPRVLRWIVAAALFLGLCTACGKSVPAVDEQSALSGLSFDSPFVEHVSLSQPVDAAGNLQNTRDSSLIALFVRAKVVSIAPSTAGAPWWHFLSTPQYFSDGGVSVPVAARVITERSDEVRWTEGSIEYYAETISYELRLSDNLRDAATGVHSNGSLRLVLQKDPAVGHWQVYSDPSRGTKWSQDDSGTLAQALAQVGAQYIGDLTNLVQQARTKAFDLLQTSLAGQGVLEKSGSDQYLLISKRIGTNYYAKPNDFSVLSPGQADQYCRNLKAAGSSWRLPSFTELTNVVQGGRFADTPDHRLWGEMVAKAPLSNQSYFVSVSVPGVNGDYSLYTLPAVFVSSPVQNVWFLGMPSIRVLSLDNAGNVGTPYTSVSARNGYHGVADLWSGSIASNGSIRIICVSGVADRSPVPVTPVQRNAATQTRPGTKPPPAYPQTLDLDAAANYQQAQNFVDRGDVTNAVMPLRLAVQYGGDTAVGDKARALAMSLASQLSPRAGVDDGCAVPVLPPPIDGATASELAVTAARARLTGYLRTSDRFAACVEGVLAGLRTGAGGLGEQVEKKLQGPVDKNDRDKQRVQAEYEVAFAAYRARHGR